MNILVRKLTIADAEQYRSCRLDALRDAPTAFLTSYEEEKLRTIDTFRERLQEQENRSDNATFGAFDGDRLIGLTGIFREVRLRRQHKMYIVSVFVRPEYRGKGVGDSLIEAAISHARTVDGVEHIELSVSSDNIAARTLYVSHGFMLWGTEPSFKKVNGVDYNEDNMTLKL
jgi:RimJ/RimL family protein N-acetyltransferase